MNYSISDFKNKHDGERVFIIGNGPSLQETPLEKLQDEYTIAMNKISLIYSSVDWRPSYFVYVQATDPTERRIKNIKDTIDLGIPSFISEDNNEYLSEKDNLMYISRDDSVEIGDCYEFDSPEQIIGSCWSRDIEEIVYRPHSSMYVAAQIASYMRFDEMYFVGCDGYKESSPEVGYRFPKVVFPSGNDPRQYIGERKLQFVLKNSTPIRSIINGISFKISNIIGNSFIIDTGDDPNHFHGNYSKVAKENLIDEQKSEARNHKLIQMHNTIEKMGDHLGFETYNATISKNIDIHKPVDFIEVVD